MTSYNIMQTLYDFALTYGAGMELQIILSLIYGVSVNARTRVYGKKDQIMSFTSKKIFGEWGRCSPD